MDKEKKTIVEVDGEQVFTARWVMEQMAAQRACIDRTNRMAAIAMLVSIVSILSVILSAIL